MKIKCEIVKVEEKSTEDGRKFNAYKTVDSKGKLIDVRFQQVTGFRTDKRGTVYGEGNVDKTRQYPCVWFKSVDRFEPFVEEDDDETHDVSDLL